MRNEEAVPPHTVSWTVPEDVPALPVWRGLRPRQFCPADYTCSPRAANRRTATFCKYRYEERKKEFSLKHMVYILSMSGCGKTGNMADQEEIIKLRYRFVTNCVKNEQ